MAAIEVKKPTDASVFKGKMVPFPAVTPESVAANHGEGPLTREKLISFGERAYRGLLAVVTPDGMNASADERFGHPFGRDTFVSASLIDAAYERGEHDALWSKTKEAVLTFWDFQRDDGKLRHEIKPFDWGEIQRSKGFFYKEGEYMVNDDSVDATPLGLIVTPQFIENEAELEQFLPRAVKALFSMTTTMDENNGWLTYRYNKHGLIHQGWMDSRFSVMNKNGVLPQDPIALVEVQAYAWKAMRLWSDLLQEKIPDISADLRRRADELKQRFNEKFVMRDGGDTYLAHALDRNGVQNTMVSINPGLALWANYLGESIIDNAYIPDVVYRLIGDGFFDSQAGIRTFEKGQPVYDPDDAKYGGYHNGENIYWPFVIAMVAKGMIETGYEDEGTEVAYANTQGIRHFNSFVEQFSKNGHYSLFRNGGNEGSCRNQTWTMAEALWSATYLLAKTA